MKRRAAKLVSVLNIRHDSWGTDAGPNLITGDRRLPGGDAQGSWPHAGRDGPADGFRSHQRSDLQLLRDRPPTHSDLSRTRALPHLQHHPGLDLSQMHSLQPDICAKIENELDRLP